jgi:TldD protein
MTPSPSALPSPGDFLPGELIQELLRVALGRGGDFGEVYGEYTLLTGFTLGEDRLRSVEHSVKQGVGIRVFDGARVGYAYVDGFDPRDLREAARAAASVARAATPGVIPAPLRVAEPRPPFTLRAPAPLVLDEERKIAMCRRANQAARDHDRRIHEVTVTLGDSCKSALIANSEGLLVQDRHFLIRLAVTALALEGSNRQQGFATAGGAVDADYFDSTLTPEDAARKAAATAVTLLHARDAEAGAYPVVVGPGWGGVMVHECFGHGLEGDGIRKQSSIRAFQVGQPVAAPMVTIVDSALVPHGRGSYAVDDEGTPGQETVVVRDGRLIGFLWDLLNARLTGNRSTGNGRRSSYRDYPLPRMTNTYIEAGHDDPEDIVASVENGLYCKNLGGGSVNPADGNFSFEVTEAYRIERGRLTDPVRNATLTGNGTDAMMRIERVGRDLAVDTTTGSCGKQGQWKPVGVGQPTVKFSSLTVGGTQA